MNHLPNFSSEQTLQLKNKGLLPSSTRALLVRYRWFVLFVILPTILALLYYGLIASDQYESQSSFVIKAPGQRSGQTSTLANLIQTTGLPGAQDETDEVKGYIRSRGVLSDLSKMVDVHRTYATSNADWLSRFPAPWKADKIDNLFKYYQDMVSADQEHDTGMVVLRTKAFTPQEALLLNRSLLDLSERLVNRLNDRAQERAIREAQNRVTEAENRVRRVRIELAQFRNAQDLIDPEKQAGAILDVISKLTIEKAALQSQLSVMQRVAPKHPSLPSIRARMNAIDAIIGGQTGRVVGNDAAIASKLGRYEALMVEQQFATQLLTSASATMEQARAEAVKQHFYLQRISEPNLPDIADYPKRLKKILTIFGAAISLYFIGWMIVVGILEHSPDD